jgi:amino acid transporter
LKQLFRKKSVLQIQKEIETLGQEHELHKNLSLRDLVSFGIAAVVGAGIFSTIGNAAHSGGPAVVFLFIFTAVACLFSALCYAQFASTIPISGSAYTYAYTTFGEIIAWILGWALIMEYAIGNVVVAISWSDYFTLMLKGLGIYLPEYFTMDYNSAIKGFEKASQLIQEGQLLKNLPQDLQESYLAWQNAPQIGTLKIVADLPALLITILITALVFIGIKESRNAGNIMVLIKLAVIFLVLVVGIYYVKPQNWSPFAPNGLTGVLQGVSAVFFAYIGFDAISTTAEECKNPQKDLPRGMIYSLIICTIIYILLALVLTGMVNYRFLNVGDPLAFVFEQNKGDFIADAMAGIIAISAVITITSVFLVFQLGQPRIFMTMSRDGLLPQSFAKIHPKYKTPYFSTMATGFMVAIPILFFNLSEVTDLTSIGTLFAFTLVSGGVLLLEKNDNQKNTFKVPYINGKFLLPFILGTTTSAVAYFNTAEFIDFFTFSQQRSLAKVEEKLTQEKIKVQEKIKNIQNQKDKKILMATQAENQLKMQDLQKEKQKTFLQIFFKRIPLYLFTLFCVILTFLTFKHNLSLIPTLGLLTNFYLMTELGINNWIGFGIWMLIGLGIYFSFGYKNSKLGKKII